MNAGLFLRQAHGHAQGGADGGAGMAGAEGVVFAFVTAQEAGDAAGLADAVQLFTAAGENFVRVGLVADVPHQPVARRGKNMMQRDGQLHRAEPGGEVAAGL